MSQIMKAYLGVLLLLLFTFTASGFLGAYLQVICAQDMHARFVDEIENSNFYSGTIEEVFAQAEKAGYELRLTIYEGRNEHVLTSGKDIPKLEGYIDMGRLELFFPFSVPFFKIEKKQCLSAYIR